MWLLLTMLACGPRPVQTPTPEPVPEAAPTPRPRLAVYVVIDQFPMALQELTRDQWTDGFVTLRADDAWVGTSRYAHASALTCPGHATLSTGAGPMVHGIVGNDWVEGGAEKYCGDIENLRADTLADRVKAAGGTVAALSLKDRGALMLGGRSPDAIAWYDKKEGRWCDAAPDWATPDGIHAALSSTWEPLKPEWYASKFPDIQDHEEVIDSLGPAFPHGPPGTDAPRAFVSMPQAGTALTDLAIAAIDELDLGSDSTPDLLTISYSQTDYIGHAYTPQSWEALDAILRLDQDLARLLSALDERVGRDGYAIVVTSDHGVADGTSKRIGVEPLRTAIDSAMAASGLEGDPLFADSHLYLPEGPEEKRAAAARAIAKDVSAIDGVYGAWAWRLDPIPEGIDERDRILAVLDPERGGDVYMVMDQSTLLSGDGKGTNHGTPWEHDTVVPLMLRGPGLKPARGEQVDARALAPTLAEWLGVEAPMDAEVDALELF